MPPKVKRAQKAKKNDSQPQTKAAPSGQIPQRRKALPLSPEDIMECDGQSVSSDEDTLPESVILEKRSAKYFAEECIIANSRSKIQTSDHTLSSLKDKIDFSKLNLLLQSSNNAHSNEITSINKSNEDDFEQWYSLLQEGFNVMLYGVGSKLSLLDKFVSERLSSNYSIVIHGFFPSLTIKQVLTTITEEILNHKGAFSSLFDHAQFISQNLQNDLYLIVHNMDSDMLNTDKAMSVLCLLAKCAKVHFVASVDHVNCGLMWDSNRASHFKFLWMNVTNFSTYRLENAYENSFLLNQTNRLALSSLHHVFHSLTPNAQGIFLLLARAQMDQPSGEQNGLTFKELFRQSREAFLVNSDLTLRTQLTEFKDHHMVRIRKGQDGIEYLQVSLDTRTLKQFLEEQE